MTAQITPNVVIENPKARKIARTVLDVAGAALGTVVAVDLASDAFDAVALTGPALAAWTYLRLVFGQAVDNPNTPKSATWTAEERAAQDARDAEADAQANPVSVDDVIDVASQDRYPLRGAQPVDFTPPAGLPGSGRE